MAPRGSTVCFVASSFFAHPQRLRYCRDFRGDCFAALRHHRPLPQLSPTRGWTISHTTRTCLQGACLVSLEMAAISGAATSVWVLEDEQEEVHRCPPGDSLWSPQGFLLAHPPGPYTCLRTVRQRSAAMLPFHLNRLWESAEMSGLVDAASREDRQSLERRTTEIVAKTMEAFLSANAGIDGGCPECMATVLYSCATGPERGGPTGVSHNFAPLEPQADTPPGRERGTTLNIVAHAWPLAAPTSGKEALGLKVLVAGGGRSRAEAKHSSWLRDRRPLDALKAQASAQEVILSTVGRSGQGLPRTLLLEGLTSNMFVVEEDGAVCTAPSGVLMGGMRELCLSACEEEGIPVRLEPPDASRAGRWQEAFLTGTGRILAPIASLLFINEEDAKGTQRDDGRTISTLELAIGEDAASATWKDLNGSEAFRESQTNKARPSSTAVAAIGRTPSVAPSVAQRIRRRMVARLEEQATLLL